MHVRSRADPGVLPPNIGGKGVMCGPLFKTFSLFMTNICDFLYFISDLKEYLPSNKIYAVED